MYSHFAHSRSTTYLLSAKYECGRQIHKGPETTNVTIVEIAIRFAQPNSIENIRPIAMAHTHTQYRLALLIRPSAVVSCKIYSILKKCTYTRPDALNKKCCALYAYSILEFPANILFIRFEFCLLFPFSRCSTFKFLFYFSTFCMFRLRSWKCWKGIPKWKFMTIRE